MYDRPTLDELLAASISHFENAVIPVVRADRKLYFQTLVAVNVLKIARRELDHRREHLVAAWTRLNHLTGHDMPLPADPQQAQTALAERTSALCADIRSGMYDGGGSQQAALFTHLIATTVEQLAVANPRFLAALAKEDEATGHIG